VVPSKDRVTDINEYKSRDLKNDLLFRDEKVQINQIEAFLAIAKSGSLAKASELMHATPAALSQRIKQFESRLGAEVFIRTTRGMELSIDGKKIYDHAVNVVNGLKDLSLSIVYNDSIHSPISVGISSAFGIEFTKRFSTSQLPEKYSHNIRIISDDTILFSLKHEIIEVGIAYDSIKDASILSTYSGNSSFIIASRYKEIPIGVNVKVYSPNIKELLHQAANKFFLKANVMFYHSDCYETAIQHVLVNNSIAIIDSLSAEYVQQRHPEIVLNPGKLTLPYYVHCLRHDKDRFQPVFDSFAK
jgi:hypothetical protein